MKRKIDSEIGRHRAFAQRGFSTGSLDGSLFRVWRGK
jgi:hypothetical protein